VGGALPAHLSTACLFQLLRNTRTFTERTLHYLQVRAWLDSLTEQVRSDAVENALRIVDPIWVSNPDLKE